jgi:hypothetical protein
MVFESDASNVDATVQPSERTCADGLLRYLPSLYRSKGNDINQVTEVKCNQVFMNTSIPEAIRLYTGLSRLDMQQTGTTGTLPKGFGLLTNLADIDLSSNPDLTGTLPSTWGEMSALTTL